MPGNGNAIEMRSQFYYILFVALIMAPFFQTFHLGAGKRISQYEAAAESAAAAINAAHQEVENVIVEEEKTSEISCQTSRTNCC